ncbi:MAG TPA: choice-of-anchor tandem repeat GloVer-containing protein [Verrucomicrobiae bacterium]
MNTKLTFNSFKRGMMLLALGAALPVGAQNFSTLHNFGTVQYDGQTPQAALAASGSKLYGSASEGGTNGTGMIFSMNTDGSGFTNLYSFSSAATTDGRAPDARLLVSGNTLYGVCAGGGVNGHGTVFRVNTDGSSFTNLHSFSSFGTGGGGELEFGEGPNSDGAFPEATLTLSGTNLYGVANDGGANGNGTIFRVSTDGSSFGVIYTFSGSPNGITNSDGGNPYGNLVLSGTTLYGTTLSGGTMGNGTIYNISIINSNFTTMHSFGGQIFSGPLAGQTDGIEPGAGLVLSPGGNLYGTCENGGENGLGTVFSIPTNSLEYGDYQTLYAWTAQSVGQQPVDDLVLLDTNLFGTTVDGGPNFNGTLFSVSINGTNTFTSYYNFLAYNNENENAPNSGGARPYGGLVFAGTNLYGTALDGGSIGYGTVFQLTVPPAILASYLGSTLPQIQTDVQTPFYAYVGGTVSNSVTITSPTTAGYHWQFNGANLTDNANITGSQSNVLTLSNVQAGEAGNYQVVITNVAGSITSSVAALTVVGNDPIGFNGSGFGWTASQTGTFTTPVISGNLLTLTDGGGSEGRSFFFDSPQYIGGFQATFTYQDVGGGGADGAAFVLQNDPRGSSASGTGGGDLGVGGTNAITPSAELELNLYTGNGETVGYTFLTNGLTGVDGVNGNYHSPGGVNLTSGDPINVTLHYAQGQLAFTFTDAVARTSFSTNLNVGNLTNIVGGATAYIGFTGGDGGVASTQTISNFSFVSIPTAVISVSSGNTVISWPSEIMGYALQKNAGLGTSNWTAVTNQATVVNGQNRVTVPLTTTTEFYRLVLQ